MMKKLFLLLLLTPFLAIGQNVIVNKSGTTARLMNGTTVVDSAIALIYGRATLPNGNTLIWDSALGKVKNGGTPFSFPGLQDSLTKKANRTFDNVATGAIPINRLFASTISGIALGNNLADLTATNGTLTFSGAYNGGTARNIGLNLGNANTWSATQTFGTAVATLFSGSGASLTNIPQSGITGLQDSITKKADKNFANVSRATVTGKVDTVTFRTTANSLTLAQTQTAFNLKQNVLSGTGLVKSTSGTISYITDNSTDWNTAYTDRLKWDGGATGLVAATGRTSLGSTTIGSNLFTLPNPSALRYIQLNADNTVSTLDAASFRTAIGAGTGGGTVTAVSIATANGFSGSSSGGTTPALTIVAGDISPTSTNGVSAVTMAYNDATSSIQTQLNGKQATLVSGTNIKTVNGSTLLGSGNLAVGDALVANPLSQFASTTSAQLRGILSDESGNGSALFQNGDLGTPSAGIATNLTGLPLTSGVVGLLPDGNISSAATWNAKQEAIFQRASSIISPINTNDRLVVRELFTTVGTLGQTGYNLKVGDDAYILDRNLANTISIKGVQDSAKAAIRMGIDPVSLEYDDGLRYLSDFTVGSIIRNGGTSSQVLLADGSVGTYVTTPGTVTSVASLTLGTSGTDLSSSVANSTTTPVITLNVPTASAANRGALSSTDWSTFNGKQTAYLQRSGATLSPVNAGDDFTTSGTFFGNFQTSAIGKEYFGVDLQGSSWDGNDLRIHPSLASSVSNQTAIRYDTRSGRQIGRTWVDSLTKSYNIAAGYNSATKFKVDSSAIITAPGYTTNGGILYTNGSGVVSQTSNVYTSGTAFSIGTSSALSTFHSKGSGTPIVTSGSDNAPDAGLFEGASYNFPSSGAVSSNLSVISNSSQAADVGGTIALGGKFNSNSFADFAMIKGGKNNSTGGDFGGYLAFGTHVNGGGLTEKMRITSTGDGNITGNWQVGSQTGSTATPNKITMAQDFSNGTTRDKLKIYLFDDGANSKFGFGVGSSNDIQYHSNGVHNFYVANALSASLSATALTVPLASNPSATSVTVNTGSGTALQRMTMPELGTALGGSFVTTSGNQTGLAGTKSWTGSHDFQQSIIVSGSGGSNPATVYRKDGMTPNDGTNSYIQNYQYKSGAIMLGKSGSFTATGTATTTFTVTIGATQANNTYQVTASPSNVLSAAVFYINNKTTTTFDVVYLTGLTGSVAFDWILSN